MSRRVIVDTGPLVAMLRPADDHHAVCLDAARRLPSRLVTTWLVMAEAGWLLRKQPGGVAGLLRYVESGIVELAELGAQAPSWMKRFFERYDDREAQMADASLIYIAEREGIDTVFTLDHRDFAVYRTQAGDSLRVVPEHR